MSRVWKEVTKDTEIVHAMPVSGAAGAGRYLGKYLDKTFASEGRYAELGMARRWSTSKWPGSGTLSLKNKEWDLIMHIPGHYSEVERSNMPELLAREGHDIAIAAAQLRGIKASQSTVRRLLSVDEDDH